MQLDMIVTGGTVVSVDDRFKADVGIREGRIANVGPDLAKQHADGVTLVDASGRYVLPGAVDVHVHLELPFCGTVSADDYDSGTKAAARGGVTTVIDFAIPDGGETLQEAVDKWKAKAAGKACVDYSFHVAITKWDRHADEMERMVEQGLTTFKQFMIYESQGWQADDAAVFGALEKCKQLGAMLLVHAESSRVLDALIARYHNAEAMSAYGARLHAMTRPNFIEAEAIQRAIMWSSVTGGRLYIVHMSTAEGADLVRAAQKAGTPVLAETCAQYLVLDDSVFDGENGHLYACCPQVKKPADQRRLWQGVKRGEICVVSTDTCTFTRQQKSMWEGDWMRIPMGLPGLETLVPNMYTHGVLESRLTVSQLVAKCCTNPAKAMGLHPRKGAIEVGSDADLVVIDPKKKIAVDWRNMATRADWNPYQGAELTGFAEKTICRGKLIVDNFEFVGESGWGRFLPRGAPGEV